MTAVWVGPQAGERVLVDVVWLCIWSRAIGTNDAANCACCKVVAAEELDLLLGFRERSHDGDCVVLKARAKILLPQWSAQER